MRDDPAELEFQLEYRTSHIKDLLINEPERVRGALIKYYSSRTPVSLGKTVADHLIAIDSRHGRFDRHGYDLLQKPGN